MLLWMSAIFIGSTDLLASHRTSRFIGPFLRWLIPGVTEETIERVQYVVRKGGHVSEYAVLAVLSYRALSLTSPGPARRWFLGALGLCALYAASDEFHQWFVATRYASVLDVLIDSCGAACGLGVVWVWRRWRASRAMTARA